MGTLAVGFTRVQDASHQGVQALTKTLLIPEVVSHEKDDVPSRKTYLGH